MKADKRSFWVLLSVMGALFFMQTQTAWALPANSRVYQTSCITCHDSPPRLNAVGENFRLNGYKFPDDEVKNKLKPLPLGDEAYERLWPEAIWPGQKPSINPISVVSIWAAEYHFDNNIDEKTGEETPNLVFVAPHEIELAWASPLGEHISIYGDARFIQEDWGGSEMYSWVALKAWIEFEDLFGIENKLNYRVGSLGMSSIHLLTARNEHGMPFQNYLINTFKMPELATNIRTSVVLYDSELDGLVINEFVGNRFAIQPQIGMEFNGFTRHLAYNIGVVNGKIDDPTDGVFFMGAGTNSSSKDYFANLAIKLGGLGFDASTGAETDDSPFAEETGVKESGDSQFWRDDSLTISFMGYSGEGLIQTTVFNDPDLLYGHAGQTTYYDTDDFWRLGAGAMWKYKDFVLNGGYMLGSNDNPYGLLDPRADKSVDSRAWFVETHYYLYPWLVPFARLEEVTFSNLPGPETGVILDTEQDRQMVTLGAKMQIRPNIQLNLEYYFYTEDEGNTYLMDNTAMLILRANF